MYKAALKLQFFSIMFTFFVMGSIEMVGIASNYIKVSLDISDTKANFLPFLVYIWFFVCTIPTGLIMDKLGRKYTLLVSMLILCISMLIAILGDSYGVMLFSFILLGIGNVCVQSSLYPLVSGIVQGEMLSRRLSVGQFVKTLSSFSAPYITMLGALFCVHFLNLGWRVVFLFYLIITILCMIILSVSGIKNLKDIKEKFTFKESFLLLKNKYVLFAFIAIMCHVGIDISTNTVSPKILMERLDLPLDKASFGASLYFMARLFGCFMWAFLLKYISNKRFFGISIFIISFSLAGLLFAQDKLLIYSFIALVGIGNSNLFPVIFSYAVLNNPAKKNMLSELMIMGQAGGAIFPLLMGIVFDIIGLFGSLLVLGLGVIYLVFFAIKLKNNN